ncbi:MAG: FAD-binding protein, partial [Sneathiellales bacterium]|nr:FAD-binding protein [Sneathiellales bacterium]
LKSALDHGVRLLTKTSVSSLIQTQGRVTGAVVSSDSGKSIIETKHGVILASGGFSSDKEMRKHFYAHSPTGQEHVSVAPPESSGDGIRLAEAVGAGLLNLGSGAGAWVPVSMVPQPDGSKSPYPHFADRSKPGLIAVCANGKRFTNEASPYFHFMKDLFEGTPEHQSPEAWLICDHDFQRRYGLGFAKPFPFPLRSHVSSGYLKKASSLKGLAIKCGIDAANLLKTVKHYNCHAVRGKDPAFGRGEEPVNRAQGDPAITPNPSLRPLRRGPYYAVKIQPGCLGSFSGLKTNDHACVLDASDKPIRGLFACGSDASSLMSGHYPAGGISLGPALVFGHIAGREAALAPV